jgi:preprotein translocase subunit SecE
MKLVNKISQFFKESYAEARKVSWPGRKQLTEHSLIVLGAIIISLIIIGAVDYGLQLLVQKGILGV